MMQHQSQEKCRTHTVAHDSGLSCHPALGLVSHLQQTLPRWPLADMAHACEAQALTAAARVRLSVVAAQPCAVLFCCPCNLQASRSLPQTPPTTTGRSSRCPSWPWSSLGPPAGTPQMPCAFTTTALLLARILMARQRRAASPQRASPPRHGLSRLARACCRCGALPAKAWPGLGGADACTACGLLAGAAVCVQRWKLQHTCSGFDMELLYRHLKPFRA